MNKIFIHSLVKNRRSNTLDKKQALKTAGYELFSKKGYTATGITEIAKQAGVAVGSFYNYYESKESIFLDVYVDENNRVRQAIMSEIDWENDMVELISHFFKLSRNLISSNKILMEWYNPAISDELHNYYSSEEGEAANPFHQFLVETFTNRMIAAGCSHEQIQGILQVYNLFYYIDMHITEDNFPNIGQTLETLATNFVKGVFK